MIAAALPGECTSARRRLCLGGKEPGRGAWHQLQWYLETNNRSVLRLIVDLQILRKGADNLKHAAMLGGQRAHGVIKSARVETVPGIDHL